MATISAATPAASARPRGRVLPGAAAVLALWLPFAVVALRAPSLRNWMLEHLAVLPGVSISTSWLGVDDESWWVAGGVTLVMAVGVGLLARRRPLVALLVGLALGAFVALQTYGLSRV